MDEVAARLEARRAGSRCLDPARAQRSVEQSIGRKVDHTIVSDGRSVVYALNRGIPFFISNREAQVSQDILRLATSLTGDERKHAAEGARKATPAKKSLFAWR